MEGLLAMMQGGMGARAVDADMPDTAETVYVSSLALLKMLKHGRAGVPFEVMGLMLGEFVDEYTVKVIDVFAMPQRGTSMSVEAVDPVFQQQMMEMLKQTGRPEVVVGWYHSHPGWDVWLSGVDMSTQQSFEQLNDRAVAVVVDPILSVKGKVVVDAFRLIKPQTAMMGLPPRETTSVLGHIRKPTIKALMHGLNKHYYSMAIAFRRNELEDRMLSHLGRPAWSAGLHIGRVEDAEAAARDALKRMVPVLRQYAKDVTVQEESMTEDDLAVAKAGKVDAKRELETAVRDLLSASIADSLGMMLGTVAFDDARLLDSA
jgi:26S proteasome regulatory subunit N11